MELVLFLITAVIAVVGALLMVLSRNAVHSALYLLLNFGAIAVLYLLLNSPFLFAVQLTVYAGAIMVLFLFVVMLLGVEKVEDTPNRLRWQTPLAAVLGLVLIGQAVYLLFNLGSLQAAASDAGAFGAPEQLGAVLFTTYLLPFEITGFILLVGVIGVVVLNQRRRAKA
jgi:NADH-quinone oxidoreductase subunit J